MFVLYSFSAIGLIWAAFGLDLLTEADHCKVTSLRIELLTEAVTLMLTASVNLFCKAVFLTASVNKE